MINESKDRKFSIMLSKIRRLIHSCPELGFKEVKTSAYISGLLERWGIKTVRIGGTGVVGILKPVSNKNCVAVRADTDALPIATQLTKSYASKINGVMHACGHDANVTIALGCAYLLSKDVKSLDKNVKFIFQPAEETSDGAVSMIKGGALKNPDVSAIFGVHVNPQLKVGEIGLKIGEMMAAVDKFNVTIYGGGGHGAYPHLGKDALLAAAYIITQLQSVVSRSSDPVEPAVLSVCRINGGERFNVLADKVEFEGTVRTLNKNLRNAMPAMIERIIKSTALGYALKYKLEYCRLGNALINDAGLVEQTLRALKKYNVKLLSKPSMGGEDFAEYLDKVRGCFIYIGSSSGAKTSYPWHHPKFDIDERALTVGAAALAETIKGIKI